MHTREALNQIKQKMFQRPMEPDPLHRDPQYGTTKNTAINMHQFIKATPRSNILKAARLIQNRQPVEAKEERLRGGVSHSALA